LGLGVDRTDTPGRRQTEPTPKLGVEYRAADRLTLRAAAFRTVKADVVAQQTIEPTVVAGFNQLFDDFQATKADQAAVAIDFQVNPDIAVGLEAGYRDISRPVAFLNAPDDRDVLTEDAHEIAGQVYTYWTVSDRVAASFELRGSRYRGDEKTSFGPRDVDSILAPLSVRYFHPSGFYAVGGLQYVRQSVTNDDFVGREPNQWDDSWLVDAAIGYRLPHRRGIVSLEFNNILDQRVHWQDDEFRSSDLRLSNRRFIPERSAIVGLNLNF
jgi:outer membrane receptor protein involved in Fe transport